MADLEIDGFTLDLEVRSALAHVRLRNAIDIAWLRIAVRVVLLVANGTALVRGRDAIGVVPANGVPLGAAHLAVGLAVLFLLRRRPSDRIITVAAASDLLSVWAAVALILHRPVAPPAYLVPEVVATLQLVLLMSALTVVRPVLVAFGGAAWLSVLVLALAIALPAPDAALTLVVMGGFTVGLTLAGARIVNATARAALEAHAGAEARWHRDALAAAHAQLRVAHEALRAAHEEAEALSALIVHDLRNPLASVHANLETLQDDLPPGRHPSREAAEIAIAEVRRVSGMTQDLLLVARLERHEVRAASPVVVSDLVDEVAQAMRPVVARSGASLSVALEPAAPVRIAVEAALVRRALDNLVVNAARHVGPGDRVALAAEPGADGELRLAVRNSGPAVPPEARARLFEKHGGGLRWDSSGLGLYLCRLVAARHGGSIALVDRPGWSVSFELSLPAATS